jgi:hypothetical protein
MCSHLHVCGGKHCEAIDVIEARFEKSGSGVDFRLEALLGSPTKKLLIFVPKSDIGPPADPEILACVIYPAVNSSFAKSTMAPS